MLALPTFDLLLLFCPFSHNGFLWFSVGNCGLKNVLDSCRVCFLFLFLLSFNQSCHRTTPNHLTNLFDVHKTDHVRRPCYYRTSSAFFLTGLSLLRAFREDIVIHIFFYRSSFSRPVGSKQKFDRSSAGEGEDGA
jgi:hypothetical protein